MPPRDERVIEVLRDGGVHEATVSWWYGDAQWTVRLESRGIRAFEPVENRADDAFEALCLVRDQLEPLGWRLGVAGAQIDVWPSGMARDQGGGLRAYRMTEDRVEGMVDTFAPVDPASVVTVDEQRAEADRLYAEIQRRGADGRSAAG